MRILELSDRMIGGNSAYSKQSYEICTRLAKLGHSVAHIPMGRANRMGKQVYQGVLVYPSGNSPFAEDVAIDSYVDFKADMLMVLKEPYLFDHIWRQAVNYVPFAVIDHSPVTPMITSRLHTAFRVLALSRFGQRELRREGIDSTYMPHACLDEDTSIWVRGDETVGVVGDVSVTSRITGVWKVPLQEPPVELVTPRRSLKITKDNLVLMESGWKPAGDVRVGEKVAVVRTVDEDLYTKVSIRQLVETYDPEAVDGGRESGSPGKLSEDDFGVNSQNAWANLALGVSKSQTVGVSKKDESLPREALVNGGQGKAQVIVPINTGLRVRKSLSGKNPRCHLPAIVEARAKAGEEDCSVAYQSETIPTGGVEMDVSSGLLGWGGNYFYNKTDSQIPVSTHPHYEQQLRGLKDDQGLDRRLCNPAFSFRTFKDSLLQSHSNVEQSLPHCRDDSPLSFREEEASGNDLDLLRYEEGKIDLVPTYGGGAGDNKSGQRVEYEKIVAVRRYTSSPFVYDLMTETENFLANGIVVHNCRTDLYRPLEDRAACRKAFYLDPDEFVVGVVAMNRARKMIPRMLRGYKRFRELNPDVKSHMMLWMNINPSRYPEEASMGISDVGVSLLPEIMELGLGEAVRWPKWEEVESIGGIPEWDQTGGWDMVKLYNCFDVLLLCSGGEGFGLPLIEAQACGVPVVATDYAAGPELVGAGLTVPWSDYVVYNTAGTRTVLADTEKIAEALTKIMNANPQKLARKAREFALRYDWSKIISDYWEPFLNECEEELRPKITKEGVSTWAK